MDTSALRTLIQPRIDASDSDAQILAWLKADVTVQRDITYMDLIAWASDGGIHRKITEAIRDEVATPGTWVSPAYNDLLILRDLIAGGGDLALSRDDVRGVLTSISGAGLPLTNTNKNALLAMSDATVSRVESAGLPLVDDASMLAHIAEARAL